MIWVVSWISAIIIYYLYTDKSIFDSTISVSGFILGVFIVTIIKKYFDNKD